MTTISQTKTLIINDIITKNINKNNKIILITHNTINNTNIKTNTIHISSILKPKYKPITHTTHIIVIGEYIKKYTNFILLKNTKHLHLINILINTSYKIYLFKTKTHTDSNTPNTNIHTKNTKNNTIILNIEIKNLLWHILVNTLKHLHNIIIKKLYNYKNIITIKCLIKNKSTISSIYNSKEIYGTNIIKYNKQHITLITLTNKTIHIL